MLPTAAIFAGMALTSMVAWLLVLRVAVAPALRELTRERKLQLLLLPQQFRHVSALLLVPGVASPDLNAAWVRALVIGDVATAVLAILAVFALSRRPRLGVPLAWIASVIGLLDLLKNVATAPGVGAADHMQAAAAIPTLLVPLMLLMHVWALHVLLTSRASVP